MCAWMQSMAAAYSALVTDGLQSPLEGIEAAGGTGGGTTSGSG